MDTASLKTIRPCFVSGHLNGIHFIQYPLFELFLSKNTELYMREWKSKVPYSSSSPSSIAELKDILAYGRLTSSHPLPPPLHPSGAPTNHPYTLSLYLLGRSVGRQRVWGGVEGEQSSSISRLLRNSCASSALTKIVPYSSSVYTVFHSVIYNSVSKKDLLAARSFSALLVFFLTVWTQPV